MRLRRNAAQTPVAPTRRLPATFSGFAEPVPNLYEFRTSDGYYVFLHEMDCLGIHFEPVRRRLTLTFECITSDVMDPLTLVLTFDEARIHEWRDDVSDIDTLASAGSPRLRGQVRDLGRIGDAEFDLQLLDACVHFEARSVRCNVVPSLSSQGPSEK